MRRLVLLVSVCLAYGLVVAPGPAAAQQAPASGPQPFRLVQANVGNVNVAACNDQAVKICLQGVEDRILTRLAELKPDAVALQETLPDLVCDPPRTADSFGTPATSPSLANPNHLCNSAIRGAHNQSNQIDRLLPPDLWDTRCNAGAIDPAVTTREIPPWDCLGIRRTRGSISDFRTLQGTAPGAVPGQTCDNGFTVSAALLTLDGRALQVTTAHPDSGAQRDGCRVEKLTRLFDLLATRDVPTIVAGDLNLDPYRAPDASTALWLSKVGTAGTTPFRPLAGIGEADPAPFTSNICGPSQMDPTGLVLDPVALPVTGCASTLDHVAVTPSVLGTCDTLGEAPGTSARLDGGGGTDHRAIACDLSFAADGPPGQVPEVPYVSLFAIVAVLLGWGLWRRQT